VFVYQVEDVELEKSIFMVHGENTTVAQYTVRCADAAECCGVAAADRISQLPQHDPFK